MANRGSYNSSNHAGARIRARTVPIGIFLIYAVFFLLLSISVFLYHLRSISEVQPLLSVESRSGQVPTLQVHDDQLWDPPFSHRLHPCVKPTTKYKGALGSDRYLTVKSNGGLNQMRTGIADMVAVAHTMNATLVIPQLDRRSFWQDSSVFSDIFDELHFIESLKGDVRIVKELPKNLETVPRARKHFTLWSGVAYYEEMKRLWNDYQVLKLSWIKQMENWRILINYSARELVTPLRYKMERGKSQNKPICLS